MMVFYYQINDRQRCKKPVKTKNGVEGRGTRDEKMRDER